MGKAMAQEDTALSREERHARLRAPMGSKASERLAVGLMLLAGGCCLWAITGSSNDDVAPGPLPLTTSISRERDPVIERIHYPLPSEEDAVRFIGSLVGEYATGLDDREEGRLARAIYRECGRQGLDPLLLVALIHVESAFQNFSESSMGARGLMQILPSVGRSVAEAADIPWEGDGTLLHPRKNIRIGVSYLKKLIDEFQDIELALAAYNIGPTALKCRLRSGGRIPSAFSEKVMTFYRDLRKRSARDLS
jgi:soluble lytic murein transglycosylase